MKRRAQSALAIIKLIYKSNLKNFKDSELLFDSLPNKKQADSFHYYMLWYVYKDLLHYQFIYDLLVKIMVYTIGIKYVVKMGSRMKKV